MKKLSKDLSPSEKEDKMKRGARKWSRHNMQSKPTNVRTLSIKMGRYRDELSELTKEQDVFSTTLDEMLQTMEMILKLPTIMKEINEIVVEPDKEACPHCGKEFKQLSKHKCKVKPENAS